MHQQHYHSFFTATKSLIKTTHLYYTQSAMCTYEKSLSLPDFSHKKLQTYNDKQNKFVLTCSVKSRRNSGRTAFTHA